MGEDDPRLNDIIDRVDRGLEQEPGAADARERHLTRHGAVRESYERNMPETVDARLAAAARAVTEAKRKGAACLTDAVTDMRRALAFARAAASTPEHASLMAEIDVAIKFVLAVAEKLRAEVA